MRKKFLPAVALSVTGLIFISSLYADDKLDQKNRELLAEEEALMKKVEGSLKSEPAKLEAPKAPEVKAEAKNVSAPQANPTKIKTAAEQLTEAQKATIESLIADPALDAKKAEVKAAPASESAKTKVSVRPAAEPAVVPVKAAADQVKTKTAEEAKVSPPPATELQKAQAKISKLSADLEETRNRLMISETEVERLSMLLDERNKLNTKNVRTAPPSSDRASLGASGLRVRDASEIQAKADTDMQIATVITEKAQLRTGPGRNNSPLMTISQGTKLAVETRQGEWYRVIAPTGTRAWISSDVVDFGDAGTPDSAARTKGYTRDVEAEAFEFISQGAKNDN